MVALRGSVPVTGSAMKDDECAFSNLDGLESDPADVNTYLKARAVVAGYLYPYVRASKKFSTMEDAEALAADLLARLAKAGVLLQGFDG